MIEIMRAGVSITDRHILLMRAGGYKCALPIEHVIETMRPLAIDVVLTGPAFLRGISVIRGEPVPVVDLGLVLGATEPTDAGRFVLIRTGPRKVALAIESLPGVLQQEASTLQDLPPLLQGSSASALNGIGVLDGELLMVLESGKIVPEEVWAAIEESRS